MAEVEQMTAPEVGKSGPKDPKSKKKSDLKLNLIVIVVSQLILAGGGFLMVSKFIKPDPTFQQTLQEQKASPDGESKNEADAAHAEAASKQIFLLEDIIVNPADTRGSRYLSVSIGVEMNAPGDGAEKSEGEKEGGHGGETAAAANPLDLKKPQLRDALIRILSAKTIIQLTSTEEKEAIRQEILNTFQGIMNPEPVYQIYFVDFVLQ